MEISEAGIEMIKGFEGFSAVPYKDGAGKMTIGYGHKILQGELFATIAEPAAESLLKGDLQDAEDAVNRLVTVEINQNQFDALVSFTFNVGIGHLEKSTLLKLLNAGNYSGASAQITCWKYINEAISPGLSRRRQLERALFDKPIASN